MALRIVVSPVAGKFMARVCKEVPNNTYSWEMGRKSPEELLYNTRLIDVARGTRLHNTKEEAYRSAQEAISTFNIKQ